MQQPKLKKGRAAVSNCSGRYETFTHEYFDDGWDTLETLPDKQPTSLTVDTAKTVITYNQSPDVPFDRSINPYRGCEHGCIYCFARPTHTWLGLSAGLDFETRLFYKPNILELLKKELMDSSYQCRPLALGINTDAYQPIERKLGLTRKVLRLMAETRHPVTLISKSSLIERDLDILSEMAGSGLIHAAISITTLDHNIARKLEPRATAPQRRLETIAKLTQAGIPTSVMIAPLIPILTDHEMETILTAAKLAGALSAAYVLLRLPHETRALFKQWLEIHTPLKASHIISIIRDTRGGKDYDPTFCTRMRGTGDYANLLAQRFRLATSKMQFTQLPPLNADLFEPPRPAIEQLSLF